MNIGGGEAADQLVRMMLSGTEAAVRLSGSALKNLLALTLALAKNNKTVSGKISLGKMLCQTRDLRQFPMMPEQYRQFSKLAKRQKILFSAIRDKDDHGKLVDVILPVTELDRANMIFERVGYLCPEQPAPQREYKSPQKRREEKGGTRDRMELKEVREAPEGPKEPPSKKDSPLPRASPDTKSSSSSHKKTEPSMRTSDRPSIEERLRDFRDELEQRRKSTPVKDKSRGKNKVHPKSR